MKKGYEIKAIIDTHGTDAKYRVAFAVEYLRGKAWEFDSMSDATEQDVKKETGYVRIILEPNVATMVFPEDLDRGTTFVVKTEAARAVYKLLLNHVNYWFLLDMIKHYNTLSAALKF